MGDRRSPLSDRVLSIWAKSQPRQDQWLCLPQHLSDSAAVAGALFDTWLAPAVRRSWGEALPDGEDDARLLISFLAGSHDLGKATPAFLIQVPRLCETIRQHGLPLHDSYPERRTLPHALASHIALEPWLTRQGLPKGLTRQLASVPGSHHGQPPTFALLTDGRQRTDLLGEGEWVKVRDELLDWVGCFTGVDRRWPAWSDVNLSLPQLVGMTGLVIMADWIASSDQYFPLTAMDSGEVFLTARRQSERFESAWSEVTMPRSWSPDIPLVNGTDLYAARFGWSDDRQARPIQLLAEKLARDLQPGLMIVEAPTGEGKTELALVVAEIIAGRWGASGLYFALPSQATSNAILTRLAHWVDRLPGPGEGVAPWSLALMHGRSRLNLEFADMAPDSASLGAPQPMGINTNDEAEYEGGGGEGVNFIAHEWFRGRKRTMLATFGVGTIDQLLFAGLQAKHLMLRHLGLAGKVVIIDEAHASDAFMNVYLDRVLEWLGEYGVPVVVLSATLPGRRRAELLAAYAPAKRQRSRRNLPKDDRFVRQQVHLGYPVITTLARGENRAEVHTVESARDRLDARVQLTPMLGSDEAILTQLQHLLSDGGCALVLRNTVRAAQQTALFLQNADWDMLTTLCHSQFIAADRLDRDGDLLRQFGPGGDRPGRHVVVSTQVAEQSLDIDFDVLLTDLPPADLLCQRLGRVHRHRRARPPLLTTPVCFLLMADLDGEPAEADPGSVFIYGRSALYRCWGAAHDVGLMLRVPDGVATFVQRAYADEPPGPARWGSAIRAADLEAAVRLAQQRDKASTFRLGAVPPVADQASMVGWLESSVGDAEPSARIGRASVRDSEDSLEVIVVPLDSVTGEVMSPPWRDDGAPPISVRSVPSDEEAHRISSWAIKLPISVTRGRMKDVIDTLSGSPAVARWVWHHHPWLRGELLLPMVQQTEGAHVLTSDLLDLRLRYTPELGLEVLR